MIKYGYLVVNMVETGKESQKHGWQSFPMTNKIDAQSRKRQKPKAVHVVLRNHIAVVAQVSHHRCGGGAVGPSHWYRQCSCISTCHAHTVPAKLNNIWSTLSHVLVLQQILTQNVYWLLAPAGAYSTCFSCYQLWVGLIVVESTKALHMSLVNWISLLSIQQVLPSAIA